VPGIEAIIHHLAHLSVCIADHVLLTCWHHLLEDYACPPNFSLHDIMQESILILGVDSRVHIQRANRMATTILSLCLGALGIIGTAVFVTSTGMVMWHFREARIWSFRWQWRNWRLLQISAIATFFFMAMTASYGILDQPWAWLYLIIACKTGTWWLRCAINRRA